MKLIYLIGVIISVVSCTSNYPLKSVDYNDLFTDSNSKVWIVNKQWVNDVNIAPHNLWAKDVMIFHSNGTVDCISLKAMGHKSPRKANYFLDSEKREIAIDFKKESWLFSLPTLKEDLVIMKPIRDSDVRYRLELIPLPEL